MLHHDERVAGFREPVQQSNQARHVLAMQAGRRLVEQQQGARLPRVDLGQVADQLEALGFAAGQRRERLAHGEVPQTDFLEAGELGGGGRAFAEELARLLDRHREQVADGLAVVAEAQHLVAEALAVARGAGQGDVGDELHLHRLPTRAAAPFAAAFAGVEREVRGGEPGRLRLRRVAEQRADGVPGADVERRVGPRRAGRGGLVDERDLRRFPVELHPLRCRGLVACFRIAPTDDLMEQRGLARARDAAEADQAAERDRTGEVAEVVDRRAGDAETRSRVADRAGGTDVRHAPTRQPVARGGGLGLQDALRRPLVDEVAALGAGARPDLDQPVGGAHDGLVVLDDHDRVALFDQAPEDADHAREVARVHADARLVEHEDRVRQASPQARGEIDALHLAAGERPGEPVEREVAEADGFEVAESREDRLERVVGRVARILGRERCEQRA